MPDSVELVRRDGIELVRTGTWALSTGVWKATREDLAAAVAAMQCPAVQKPIIKIGHTDDRFTPGDGEPALGWCENLRLADGGHTLIADQVAPKWLSDIQAAAWPNRSIEGTYNKRCGLGHTHPFVITAVALLGVTPPGVSVLKPLNSLADVKALYGLAASTQPQEGEVHIRASMQVAAADQQYTGAMVALIPTEEDAQRLAVEGGEPADQLHVTLLHLGEADQIPNPARRQIIGEVMRAIAGIPPLTVDAFSVGVFNPNNPDRDTCIVLSLSGEELDDVRALAHAAVMHAQQGQVGFVVPEPHTPWHPHITLRYTDDLTRVVEYSDRTGPVTFDRVRIAFAGEHVDLPLTGAPDDDMPDELMSVEAAPRDDRPLRNYWLRGRGAARIRWGTPGDFTRCVRLLRGKVRDPRGLCAEYHFEANGFWPGDRRNRRARVAAQSGDDMPNPNPINADRVREEWNRQAPHDQWVVEVYPDHVIVCSEADRTFARVPVIVAGDTVVFGEPTPVRPGYVPADTVAASAVYASRAESRPNPDPDGVEAEPEPDVAAAVEVSDRPWSDFSQADYTPEQWRRACLIDTGEGDPDSKSRYKLPVREPDGTINRNAVHAAAARIGQVDAPQELIREAARTLARIYREIGDEPPESLLDLAGVEASAPEAPLPPPADQAAVEAASEPSAAEPEQSTQTETTDEEDRVSTLIADVRARLGLPDDADDAAVLAALDEVKAKADNPPTPEPDPQEVAAAAEQQKKLAELETKVALLTEQLQAAAQELAESRARAAAEQKERVLAAARRDGKIKPSDYDKWAERYDKAPETVTEILASIPVGTAVPVSPAGYTASGDTAPDEEAENAKYDYLFSTPAPKGV